MRRGFLLPVFSYRSIFASALILICLIPLLGISITTPAFADCGGGTVTEPPPKSKQINIVMDDSGSMFWDGKRSLDRWSFAKYSLEVFAALMNREDSVNVYLMSDFKDDKTPSSPSLQIQGSQSSQERVQQVRKLPLAGFGTPYKPVEKAWLDLKTGSAEKKWLVILTDGKFDKINPSKVEKDLQKFVSEDSKAKIASLAIGDDAAQLPADQNKGIYSFRAGSSQDLIIRMNEMANLIFQRTAQELPKGSFSWPTDIATRDVYVFAQGEGVEVKSAKTSTGTILPDSSVKVQWSDNDSKKVDYNGKKLDPVPAKSLNGVLATFKELPKGDINFEIPNSNALVQVIFKPNVKFNAIVRDESNKEVSGTLRAGTYTIDYGFLDEKCRITKSDLLGDVTYSATVTQNGQPLPGGNISPGGTVKIVDAGDITIDVKASYLKNLTSSASINFGVKPAESSLILESQPITYNASELDKYVSLADSINANIMVKEGEPGKQTTRPFTDEEWSAFTPKGTQIDKETGLELKVNKGDQVGQLTIRPRALDKNVFGVKTGDLQVPIQLPALNDANKASTSQVAMTIENDISPLARFWNWFKKWLPLLLLIALILGYIFKPRFATRGRIGIKRKPSIEGTPMQIGQQAFSGRGKFEINQVRRFLPFVADTATLAYVPTGVFSFPKLKLKAARQKKIVVLNWKQIAARKNTEINGIPLDETTTSSPTLRASSSIRANDPAMTYDMTLNQ